KRNRFGLNYATPPNALKSLISGSVRWLRLTDLCSEARCGKSDLGSGPINPASLAPNPRNISGLERVGKCGSFSKRSKPLR
ncbi:MAG: hypothetical protein AAFN63_19755, partial [Pseudomonadota bacterium]